MKRRRYHVKLADDNEPSEADSDDSTYDSFNEMETGSFELFIWIYESHKQ